MLAYLARLSWIHPYLGEDIGKEIEFTGVTPYL